MRTLRFSAVWTVFLFTILPALVGGVIGAFFFGYHLLTHLGSELNIHAAFNTWLLTVMHGLVMYAIPSLFIGIVLMFLLDRGIATTRVPIFCVVVGIIMSVWAIVTVEFTGPIWVIFVGSVVGTYVFLRWVTVPLEKRTVPRVFDSLK